MKVFLLTIIIIASSFEAYSQAESPKGLGATLLPTVSVGMGKHLFSEVGLAYCPYMEMGHMGSSSSSKHLMSNYYVKASAEFNYNNPFIIGPKLSFHYRYLAFLESGLNMVAYMN